MRDEMSQCDDVYTERNRLVAALTKLFPSVMIRNREWEEGWQHVIYVHGPEGQMSWHIGDNDLHLFSHLEVHDQPSFDVWDGHTTDEKYERLNKIRMAPDDNTILTYKETLLLLDTLERARRAEQAWLDYNRPVPMKSELLTKLKKCINIIERKRFHAEEGGT